MTWSSAARPLAVHGLIACSTAALSNGAIIAGDVLADRRVVDLAVADQEDVMIEMPTLQPMLRERLYMPVASAR